MGKNKSKKNQPSNSEKWEKRIDKGIEYGTKALTFVGAAISVYGGYKGLKNQNKS